MTLKLIIEVKRFSLWKHALGQILAYAMDYPQHIKCVHLFGDEREYECFFETSLKCFRKHSIQCTYNLVCDNDGSELKTSEKSRLMDVVDCMLEL